MIQFEKYLVSMSPYSQKFDVFPFPFFQNKNLILFPLLDSTDASRIHSDNKPRRENQQAGIKRKSGGDGESLSNPNSSLTIEEWS